jgi:hypothetical protein
METEDTFEEHAIKHGSVGSSLNRIRYVPSAVRACGGFLRATTIPRNGYKIAYQIALHHNLAHYNVNNQFHYD